MNLTQKKDDGVAKFLGKNFFSNENRFTKNGMFYKNYMTYWAQDPHLIRNIDYFINIL